MHQFDDYEGIIKVGQANRVKGELKKMWIEVIRKDINAKDLNKDILLGRNELKRIIRVSDVIIF